MKTFSVLACGATTLLIGIAFSASCDLPTLSLSLGPCNISIADGGDQDTVYSWGALLVINGTQICASPSTFVATPLIDHEDVCSGERRGRATLAQCRSRRGNYLAAVSAELASTDGLKEQNPNMENFQVDIQKATRAPIQFQPGTSVQVLSGLVTNWENHTNSHLPLNEQSTILSQLKQTGVIGARSFALDVGPQNYPSPRRGRLILGGLQPGMVRGPFLEYRMDKYSQTLNGRLCPLQVGIQQLSVTVGNETLLLIGPGSNTVACIEPYDRLFRLNIANLVTLKGSIARIHGLEEAKDDGGFPVGRYGDVLDLEPGLVYSAKPGVSIENILPSMQITISGGLSVNLTAEDLVQPVRALNAKGIPVVNNNLTEVMVYRDSGIGDAPVLGRALLAKLYMFVDYEKSVFNLGLLDQEAPSQNPIPSGSCGKPLTDQDKGLIGLGIAIFVLAVVTGGLVYFFRRKLKSQQAELIELRTGQPNTSGGDGGARTPPRFSMVG